jgi:hypothetical protein
MRIGVCVRVDSHRVEIQHWLEAHGHERMAESLQEEKQKLLTDGRAGSEQGFWKRLFGG